MIKMWCVRTGLMALLLAVATPALAMDDEGVGNDETSPSSTQVMPGDWSVSAGGVYWYYNEDGLEDTATGAGISLRLGHQLTAIHGWEAMISTGGSGDANVTDLGNALGFVPKNYELDLLAGGFYRPVIVRDRWQLYGLIGVSLAKVSFKTVIPMGFNTSGNDTVLSLSYGGGGEVRIARHWALDLEWAQYVGGQLGGFSVLVKRYFKPRSGGRPVEDAPHAG